MSGAVRPAVPGRGDRLERAAVVGVFVALYLLWLTSVVPFRIPYHYWQLLPTPALEHGLLSALGNLHAQPPVLNLVLGALLKASSATGLSAELLGMLLCGALGALTASGLWLVARRMVPQRWLRLFVLVLLLGNPYLYAAFAQLFYTSFEIALLTALAVLALRHFDAPSPGRLAAALSPGLILVHTRSLFHPLWFVLVACLLLLSAPRPLPRLGRSLAVVAVFGILLLAWPLKNLERFGFFGHSSWAGINLSRGLPLRNPVLEGLTQRRIDPALARRLDALVPTDYRADPGIARAAKPDGSPNWNHFAVLGLSVAAGRAARDYLAKHPGVLLARAGKFYLGSFATYEARDPYADIFAVDMSRLDPSRSDVPAAEGWLAWYERIVFQRFRPARALREARATTGFALLFPVLFTLPPVVLWIRRRRWGAAERLAVLMVFCEGWVLAMALLIDGYEANRMRFSTEPYLFLTAAGALGAVLRDAPGARPDDPGRGSGIAAGPPGRQGVSGPGPGGPSRVDP